MKDIEKIINKSISIINLSNNNISKNKKFKKFKENNIKSQIPYVNLYNKNNYETYKLYMLSKMYIDYANKREKYEKIRKSKKNIKYINMSIEQVGSYLCCLSIELLLKAILFKQKGNLKIDNKVIHSIKKNWENIRISSELKERYNNFIKEIDTIYGKNGDKLRYNQNINGRNYNNYNFSYKKLLKNTNILFKDLSNVI